MSALSVCLGLGAGLCLVGGPWAGRGAALVCLTVGGLAAWSGAWAVVGPALALAALVGRREETSVTRSRGWAPLTLCALTTLAVAWSLAHTMSPARPAPAATASLEALRGEPWLALGVAAILVLAAMTPDEEAP